MFEALLVESKKGAMIKDWNEIKQYRFETLLLGNGFSIGISDRFKYESLLDQIDLFDIPMYPMARDLFREDKVNTHNFEEILRVIYHASLVNFYNQDAIKQLYFNVQKSLIDAVNQSHVAYSDVPIEAVADELKKYGSIFTTNYDLILYWSLMGAFSFRGFCDYFWSYGCEFDLSNTTIWDSKRPIYYLDGAVHLKTNPDGVVYKVTASEDRTLSDIISSKNMGNTPLFISEGKSEIKLRRIRENYYLGFCYDKLLRNNKNMVVYGHGLDKEYDEHILSALKKAPMEKLAFSVFSGLGAEQKEAFASNIRVYFSNTDKELHFFESDTHPLSM